MPAEEAALTHIHGQGLVQVLQAQAVRQAFPAQALIQQQLMLFPDLNPNQQFVL